MNDRRTEPPDPLLRGRWPSTLLVVALAATLATPLLCAAQTAADPAAAPTTDPPAVVHLDNGDRLSGEVRSLVGGELVLGTGYAGEVSLDAARVVSLDSRLPLTLVLTDGTRLRATVAGDGAGGLVVRPATGSAVTPRTVALADVEAINPPEVPPVRYRGHAAVALTASSGNTDSRRSYAEAELVARTDASRYTVGGQLDEAREDGRRTASNTQLWVGWDRFFGDRWYLNTQATFREDEFQGLDLRTTLGAAAGYQFSEDEDLHLSAELGASYVRDDFTAAPDDEYPAARWSLDLSRHLRPGDGLELFHLHEVLQSLEESDDTLLRTRTGLRFRLWKNLQATFQVNYDRDESPAPGRKKDDTTWLLNLGVDW